MTLLSSPSTMEMAVTAEKIGLVEFSHAHSQNPFSRARMRELVGVMDEMDADDRVACVLLYGGSDRSFGAGGDFNEVSEFSGGDEVDAWIDDIADLYGKVASIRKPVVAAIDGYAIGIGLQIALCCDYRLGSTRSHLVMPEFRLGIACNFGGYMLEAVVGRSVMQHMLYTCEEWPADRAQRDRLLHEVTDPVDLLATALDRAGRIAGYTESAVQGTRSRVNAPFVEGLARVRREAKLAHRAAFAAGEAQVRMRRILGQEPVAAP